MELPTPDLVIAIDFGMTCTGVAYANLSIGSDTIRWIQRWPGNMQANENKVPTVIVYPANQLTPSSWGFLSESGTEQADNKEPREWFKTLLDQDWYREEQINRPDKELPPIETIENWTRDYFRYLCQYIESKLTPELGHRSWEAATIEFIFSVPTTWKPYPTIEGFRSIIEQAGFGKHVNHTVSIGLTEAEAAAVHMARESPAIFKERDILLVCDAGGGTTDLSVLRVTDTAGGTLSLDQLDTVFGKPVGSAQIDTAFEKAVQVRLEMANRTKPLNINIEDASFAMMKSREFQNAKCDYGSLDDTDFFSVAIPNSDKDYVVESLGIVAGELRFKRDELQALFDVQLVKMFELIDKQIERLKQILLNERVTHLVLSGGLGNSLYIQKRLRSRYGLPSSTSKEAFKMQVRAAPDPQLAVCKGIVADRLQKIRSGRSVLKWRCCRASYGTIHKTLYDHKNPFHFNQPTEVDETDGKVYVNNVVNWFIHKNEPVSIDSPIIREFRQTIKQQDTSERIFPVKMVVSYLDKDLLPYRFNKSCSIICNIQCDFSTVNLTNAKVKTRHYWKLNKKQKYVLVDYLLKVALGPADITFELWFDGRKLNEDRTVKVEWYNASPPTPSRTSSQTLDPGQLYV